ncbi:threonine/serine dehydratase [Brevibacterium jeotgali]|uniref:Threonine dehydratase n=1 Tax=Brevibacterium jeotgali TaxID=1262550 RepID=A0A2H1L4D7_9MICO|nr:threonine/serine dehydratase [Brevibacterium jeotgali]TWB98633.1 L-threonine ammonia-lyase [Brevibacterium jeotgali]SMY11766.1 threonine dehydratase [Brevibacterium jeotgali]
MLTRSDVLSAHDRVRAHVRRTPMIEVEGARGRFLLKCEYLQHTGSFKARGAFNRVLATWERGELDPDVGIVVASGGNAGMANAFAARQAGVPATVFVPETAPQVKVARLESYGAIVRPVGREYAEAFTAAMEHTQRTGAVYCHAYDQPEITAGAGTMAEEILQEAPDVDTIVVAVGGGGLLAGTLAAAEGRAKVVGVEPRTASTLSTALAHGAPVDIDVSGIAADSLGARRIGDIGFDAARRVGVTSLLVEDDSIASARAALWEDFRIAAEHGAATAYAAFLSGAYVPAAGERVAVVVCGANTDTSTL